MVWARIPRAAFSSLSKDTIMSSKRLHAPTLVPDAYRALAGVSAALGKAAIGKRLTDLVWLRISQLNGCAYCVDLHARDLLAQGEDWQRVNSLVTWREVGFYSERERAALNWAESLTLVDRTHAPDADYAALAPHFSEQEIAELTMAAALMNAWNRIGVGLRLPVAAAPLKPAG